MSLFDWLKKKFCAHEWEMVQSGTLYNRMDNEVGKVFILRCKHCGDYARRRLML